MGERLQEGWGREDPLSRALIELTADRRRKIEVEPRLVELAQKHGLVGLLADEVHDPLIRAIHARNTARTSIIEVHGRRILERLHGAGLRAALLKGPWLRTAYYRNPDHRVFSDLDVLVEESKLQRVLDVLADDAAVRRVPPKRPKADKRDVVVRDPSGILFNLDIHWNLFSYSQLRGAADQATEEVWDRSEPWLDSSLGPQWVLPFGIELCFLAAHAVLDHRFRLILFRDFLEIGLRSVDWDAVLETANRYHLRHPTYVPLWIARTALGANIPDAFLEELRPSSLVTRYLERALPNVDLATFDGRTTHLVNLASVLLNDSARTRWTLAMRAPSAYGGWRRRVVDRSEPSEDPRALIVVQTDRRRGAEVVAERLERGLLRRGFLAEAVSLTSSGERATAGVYPLTSRHSDDIGKLAPELIRALRTKIRDLRPNVVLVAGPALRYGVLASLGLDVKVAYLAIGEPLFWTRAVWRAVLQGVALRRVDRVLAVSERTRQQLLRLEPSLEGRIDVVFTGVPTIPIELSRRDFVHGPLRVLAVGALSREKNPKDALRSAARVQNCVLRFVGSGPLVGQMRELAVRLAVDDRVEFVGAVDDVGPHLAWAHVLILSSLTEGLPGVVLEAGMAGVPSVAYDVGGVKEAVLQGVTGILVNPGNVDGLTEALDRLARNRAHLGALGLAAREHVEAHFELESIIDRYVRSLAATLGE